MLDIHLGPVLLIEMVLTVADLLVVHHVVDIPIWAVWSLLLVTAAGSSLLTT